MCASPSKADTRKLLAQFTFIRTERGLVIPGEYRPDLRIIVIAYAVMFQKLGLIRICLGAMPKG